MIDWAALSNWGIGGAVIVVVVLFLKHIRSSAKDLRDLHVELSGRMMNVIDNNTKAWAEAMEVLRRLNNRG